MKGDDLYNEVAAHRERLKDVPIERMLQFIDESNDFLLQILPPEEIDAMVRARYAHLEAEGWDLQY